MSKVSANPCSPPQPDQVVVGDCPAVRVKLGSRLEPYDRGLPVAPHQQSWGAHLGSECLLIRTQIIDTQGISAERASVVKNLSPPAESERRTTPDLNWVCPQVTPGNTHLVRSLRDLLAHDGNYSDIPRQCNPQVCHLPSG